MSKRQTVAGVRALQGCREFEARFDSAKTRNWYRSWDELLEEWTIEEILAAMIDQLAGRRKADRLHALVEKMLAPSTETQAAMDAALKVETERQQNPERF